MNGRMGGLVYQEESYAIRGAVYDVYKTLGPGFLEAVYQEALKKEMIIRNIFAERQGGVLLRCHGEVPDNHSIRH